MLGGRYYPMGVFTPVYPNTFIQVSKNEKGWVIAFQYKECFHKKGWVENKKGGLKSHSTLWWSVVTKCAYLIPHLHICSDWLITQQQISRVLYFCMGYSDKMWYLGSGGYKNLPMCACHHQMCIFNTSFAFIL